MHLTNSKDVFINLETVEKLKNKEGYILNGWIGSTLGKINSIYVGDQQTYVEFTDRPDVLEYYPDFKTYQNLGFEFEINTTDISKELTVNISGTSTQIPFANNIELNIGSLFNKIVLKSGFKKETHKDIIVVDDFYENPDAVRSLAMSTLEFKPSEYHKGQRATERLILDGTKEKLEEIIGRPIYNWEHGGYANGIFQFCTSDQPIVYHIDTQMMAAMVYLTPDAPVSTGTAMYKSKTTGVRSFPDDTRNTELYTDTFKGLSEECNFYDSTQFEMVDTVGNVYNRLVIFNSTNIHAATEYFGDNINNSRFFHMFFFDVE